MGGGVEVCVRVASAADGRRVWEDAGVVQGHKLMCALILTSTRPTLQMTMSMMGSAGLATINPARV